MQVWVNIALQFQTGNDDSDSWPAPKFISHPPPAALNYSISGFTDAFPGSTEQFTMLSFLIIPLVVQLKMFNYLILETMNATQLEQLPDKQLVIDFQNTKEADVFEVLYHRYAKKVFYYCYKILGNREDAKDISMEVFEKVFERLDGLRETATFQAWLFRIARNRSINACLKRQHKFYIPIDETYDLADDCLEFEEFEQREVRADKMDAAIQALPPETQDLLIAKYYYRESIETLMQRYHLSESAVKMRLARARQKANELLARA